MDTRRVLLASLFHDIGKVVRRSGYSVKNHSDAGVDFIIEEGIELPNSNEIIEVMKHHHAGPLSNASLSTNHIAYIIYEADNIASAIDRRKLNEGGLGNEMLPLESVFNVLNEHKGNQKEVHHPIINLENDIDLPIKRNNVLTNGEYSNILEKLRKQLKSIDFMNEAEDTILNIFESLLKNIPSSAYVDVPDISLYDHLKLTGAIAVCLYEYFNEKSIMDYRKVCFDSNSILRDENSFLLVSGDFSGIQGFIYTIASQKAMKSLRGRSLYLELICENIVDEILEATSLSRANLIYTGGGHFYLLLPNTELVMQVLEQAQEQINQWMLEKFHLQLYLSIGWTPCSANELGNQLSEKSKTKNLIGDIYQRASYEVSKKKINRYSNKQLRELFNPQSSMNKGLTDGRECSICKKSSNLLDEENICIECNQLIQLGRQTAVLGARNDDSLIVIYDDLPEKKEGYLEMPSISGQSDYLQILKKERYLSELKSNAIVKRAYAVNRLVVGEHLVKNIWIGNYNKKSQKENGLIEFDELIEESKGIQRLAVLRADIDNLGTTFINGFIQQRKEEKYQFASLSRSAVLSRKLSEFFKQDINKIAGMRQSNFKYCNYICGEKDTNKGRDLTIVYSGGDDVFVIGTWNDVVEFSIDLRRNFQQFAQNKLTFSAGIAIFHNGFPVHQMARLTGELERISKSLVGKDSITIFSEGEGFYENGKYQMDNRYTFKWDRFIEDVMEEKYQKLSSWFGEDDPNRLKVGKSSLYKIFNLFSGKINKENQTIDIARLAYLIGRLEVKVEKGNKAQATKYNEMRVKLYEWMKSEEEARSLYTALQLMIYSMRDKEGSYDEY